MNPKNVSLLMAAFTAALAQAAPGNLPTQRAETLTKIHPSLRQAGGEVTAVVRLVDPPLLSKLGRNAKTEGIKMSRSEQTAYVRGLKAKQAEIIQKVVALGGSTSGSLTKALNAVVVTVSGDKLADLADLASVITIKPVVDYQLDLTDTVPYIGATAAQTAGFTGEGVRVAVLDSGIDYTHKNLGGAGTLAAYEGAYGTDPSDPRNTTRDGLFPTAKVIGGWDFVGEDWPNSDEVFDEDPIDFGGHGSHVADIIGGASLDGTHKGVAPGASLYAFKVCSAVDTACSGLGIMMGLEASLSPDSPVDVEFVDNPVDIINLSLGSSYGQIQDDSAFMVELISQFGITVVASAGNSGDRPYVAGSPSIAPGALSVAQTQVPGAKAFSIRLFKNSNRVTSEILNTEMLDWAPINKTVNGPVVYVGQGCVSDTYLVPPASVKNAIVVIDRGACNISEKIDRAARLGAKGVILANNVPGDPPSFSLGNGSKFVPSLVISQADGTALKSSLPGNVVRATFGPSLFKSMKGSMASTSSRGPSYSFQTIKPEIGAPGASVSAEVGTGTGATAFGGTSGAAPMVAGAAALLQNAAIENYGGTLPGFMVKALLMNTSDTNILINPVSQPGILAPITRIGAGEVRVDKAIGSSALVVEASDFQAALSFGYQALTLPGPVQFTKTLLIINLGVDEQTFQLSGGFRYADDAALGAVSISFSETSVTVPGGFGSVPVDVTLTVDPTKLAAWTLNGGTLGGNGNALRLQEIDGYVTAKGTKDTLRMPWHLLPRKAADQEVSTTELALVGGIGSLGLSNPNGAVASTTEIFALGATSPLDYPKPDMPGGNAALPDLKAGGIRLVNGVLEVAIATHEERSHPAYPAEFDVYVDVNNDGIEDFVFYNSESNGNVLVNVVRLSDNTLLGSVAADVDFNSSTIIYRLPAAAVGVSPASTVNWYVLAFDNYFTGAFTDFLFSDIGYIVNKMNTPRFAVAGSQTVTVPSGGSVNLSVSEVAGGATASPTQNGLFLIHRQAQPGRGSDVIETIPAVLPED